MTPARRSRKLLFVAVAAMSVATCVHGRWSQSHHGPDVDRSYFEFLDEHHAYFGHVDRCWLGFFPRPQGYCDASEATRTDGGTQKRSFRVACGDATMLCGQSISCDCASPIAEYPCGRDLAQRRRAGLDAGLDYQLTPPHDGACWVAPPPGGWSLFPTAVLVGDEVPFDRTTRCRCDEFTEIARDAG